MTDKLLTWQEKIVDHTTANKTSYIV